MKLTTLEREQTKINREVASAVAAAFHPYREEEMPRSLWLTVLFLVFGVVSRGSERSARLSRRFYDEERERVLPGFPRHDILLQLPTFERFVEDMEEVFPRLSRPGATKQDVARAALRAVRTVENAGRWTMMKAVETPDPVVDSGVYFEDSDDFQVSYVSGEERRKRFRERLKKVPPGTVRGWARVATGRETCGWCLMLVSRGAVYASAQTAGARLSTRDALQTTGSDSFDPKEHMHAWHTGCDCKIVPVFKLDDWEGKERFLAARKMWYATTKDRSGKDAIKAFSRAAEKGLYEKYLAGK